MATDRDSLEGEAARYRRAAELAMDQLEWCIQYLHRIHRPRIARLLDMNRKTIIKRHRP